jgi:hypothetical protein
MVLRTILSEERRELGRAAGKTPGRLIGASIRRNFAQ